MTKNDDKITSKQLTAILVLALIGIGSMSLPRRVAELAGSSGWLLIITGCLLALAMAYLITKVGRLYIENTFAEYSKRIVGNFFGNLFSILYILYFIFFAAMQLRIYGEVLKMFLLYYTPIEFVILTMLFTTAYIVRHGIEPIARFSEIILVIFFIFMALLLIPTIKSIDLTNLLPIFHINIISFIKGTLITAFSFVGFEVMLFILPYMKKPEESTRFTNYAIIWAGIFNLIMTIVTYGVFGVKENRHIVWPVITLVKTINLPGFFVENLEGIMLGLWTFAIFSNISVILYAVSLTANKIIKASEYNYFVYIIIPIVYLCSMLPTDFVVANNFFSYIILYFAAILIVIIPLLLYMTYKIRGLGGKDDT